MLKECLERLFDKRSQDAPAIQVFATDIDPDAIDKARRGTYPAGISAEVSPERLQRYFDREDGGYRIKKVVRDQVVFATQNILIDPPSRRWDVLLLPQPLNLLECRDAKEVDAVDALCIEHRRTIGLGFRGKRRRLRPLILAAGQEVEGLSARPRWLSGRASKCPCVLPPRERGRDVIADNITEKGKETDMDILFAAQRALLDRYGPPSVVVNSEGDIVYIGRAHGEVPGPASERSTTMSLPWLARGCA